MNAITFNRKTAVGIGVLALLLLGAFALAAYADHAWSNYHWARTSNSFTLQLGDNVSSTWDGYLSGASSDWNTSVVFETAIVSTGGTNNLKGRLTPKNCVPTLGRVEVCSTKYGYTGWLGIASVWTYSDGHIAQGTAKVNDTYFNTAKYNTPAWRRLVMCQEIAHTFGLDHQDELFSNANLGTCMDYTNAPDGGVYQGFDYGPSNEHPNAHDYEMLETIYGHLERALASASAGQGNGNAQVDLNDPSAWGKGLRQDGNGRDDLFVRDLGNGNKVFTFVIWAQ